MRAFQVTRKLPAWKRAEVLGRIADGIEAAKEDFARTIALEAGKPIKTARLEAERAAFTFRVAAEETKRIHGELLQLDWLPGTEGRTGQVRRVPLGPIAGISPFNFPLNLVAHKVAPALAAGNPIVVRPASQTPISALKLAQIVLEAGWPEEGIAVVPSTTADAAPLVEDDRFKLLTFTGSPAVGWQLKGRSGMKRVTLELGGNAAVVVAADADADYAAERIVWGGTANSGQTCISVQRVYHHESLEGFEDDLARRFGSLVAGDPLDEATDVGPLIGSADAERVEEWLREAVAGGARILAGGERDGRVFQPTLLAGIEDDMKVSCEELFAPVIGLSRVHRPARRARPRGLEQVRPPGGPLHERPAPRRGGVRPHRGRRADGQRRLQLPRRPHAVRRREAVRPRPRGPALRDRGDERAAAADVQPAAALVARRGPGTTRPSAETDLRVLPDSCALSRRLDSAR